MMKALVQNAYGSPDVLQIKEIDKPEIKANEVLVCVQAASLNAGDVFSMKGSPWLARFTVGFPKPKDYVLGWDMAGYVEAVGSNVTRFQPGDEVYAASSHTFAEYVCAAEDQLALKPANLTFEESAAVPTAALTALQGLRDAGKLQSGQKVLINGASGGVGTFAIQIAKALGAEVAGVCSTRNVEMVKSLSADEVFDYKKEDFTKSGKKYDLILDNVASRSLADLRRVLTPQGLIVPNSGHGGMSYVIKSAMMSLLMSQHGSMFMAKTGHEDLETLKGLIEAGKITPVIDKVFSLRAASEAFRHLEAEHARGKIVITM
jgi:NADPH:quinone reductase-like Zn-dependent oxidoreductase